MKRRDFLKASIIAGASIAGTPYIADSSDSEKPKIKKYKEIGKTGLKMSDISYGTGGLPSPSMILRPQVEPSTITESAPQADRSVRLLRLAISASSKYVWTSV